MIGLTGALTGPPASTYAPAVDALRIYIDRVNAAGGVNGKKINLILQDDSAQPGKAAANAKKLLTQDNVILMLNASLSSTYAPVIAEAKQANVPLLFASSVCPQSGLSAGRSAAVLHDGVRGQLRQPRHARLHQGDGEGAGEARLVGHGDPALARRDGLCRAAGALVRHDRRGQGDHPAADARLHAVRDQDQGRGRQLGATRGRRG